MNFKKTKEEQTPTVEEKIHYVFYKLKATAIATISSI